MQLGQYSEQLLLLLEIENLQSFNFVPLCAILIGERVDGLAKFVNALLDNRAFNSSGKELQSVADRQSRHENCAQIEELLPFLGPLVQLVQTGKGDLCQLVVPELICACEDESEPSSASGPNGCTLHVAIRAEHLFPFEDDSVCPATGEYGGREHTMDSVELEPVLYEIDANTHDSGQCGWDGCDNEIG